MGSIPIRGAMGHKHEWQGFIYRTGFGDPSSGVEIVMVEEHHYECLHCQIEIISPFALTFEGDDNGTIRRKDTPTR